MSTELREILHRAAAAPGRPLDLSDLRARSRRRRRRRAATVTASVAMAVGAIAAMVFAVPEQAPEPPTVSPERLPSPMPGPLRPAELPAGWTSLPPPPEVRAYAATAWTGEQLLTWGGWIPNLYGGAEVVESDGFVLDTGTGEWREMAPSPLSARGSAAAAWTGDELLVWGGVATSTGGAGWLSDGAAYRPAEDTWRPLPPAPIGARAPLSVWTGRELIVWGTAMRRGDIPTDGAAYDPATDTWRPIAGGPIELTDATAVWTGEEMIVFGAALRGGNVARTPTAIGAAYDPATDTWRRLPDSALSPQASTAAWAGGRLIAWDYNMDAAAYYPELDEWRSLSAPPLDSSECYPASVSLDAGVFGEFCGGLAVYEADADRWTPVTSPAFSPWGRDPEARPWWLELVPADPVVLLLGWVADDPLMLAYRHPG